MSGPNLKLRHLGMYVWNIQTMADFYQEVLGFWVTDRGHVRGHDVVFLSRDPTAHHQLVMETGRPLGSGSGYGLQQISFQVQQLEDLRTMNTMLKKRTDVHTIQTVDHGNSWSLYFCDPEANRVEIYLDTPWHVAQPHLNRLDLEQSDAAITQATERNLLNEASTSPIAQWQARMAQLDFASD